MPIQDYPETDLFKKQIRESFQREIKNSRAIKIPKHENVYTIGEQDEMVYFVENGQVKLSMFSSEGRECLLAIHAAGDVFGELCLSGLAGRLETAAAMEDTLLKKFRVQSSLSVWLPIRYSRVSSSIWPCVWQTNRRSSLIS